MLSKDWPLDFSGGPMVRNLPANAGDSSSTPSREDPTCHRIAYSTTTEPHSRVHKPQLLGLSAATTEASKAWAPQQEKPLQWEAHVSQQSSLCLSQLLCTATKTQHSKRVNGLNFFKKRSLVSKACCLVFLFFFNLLRLLAYSYAHKSREISVK